MRLRLYLFAGLLVVSTTATAHDTRWVDTTIDDGAYLVPDQIQLGTYRAPGGIECRWQRLEGDEGEISTAGESGRRQIVAIRRTDRAFISSGCGRWQRLATIDEPVDQFDTAKTVLVALAVGLRDRIDRATVESIFRQTEVLLMSQYGSDHLSRSAIERYVGLLRDLLDAMYPN